MNLPIRVLHVFTILNRGGAESMIMNYYRQIDRNIIQFDFLVHRHEKGVFEDEIESLGGKIYRIPRINPLFPQQYYKELNEFFKNNKYKIIHSHINTFSSFPLKIAKNYSMRCRIAHAHTTTLPVTIDLLMKRPKDALKIIFKNYQKKHIAKYATNLFACGEKSGNWLFNNDKYEVLPNAINVDLYKYNNNKAEVLKSRFDLGKNRIIGHVGNYAHPKNHPFILKVFSELQKRQGNFKLVLVGDGTSNEELKSFAKSYGIFDDILFLGIRSDVPDLLQMMDVFLFPSLYEGLPVTLVEAQASGLKVFASDSITREVALTVNITYLSLNDSPQSWAEQIINALPYDRMDTTGIIKGKGYDIVENARRLEKFYLEQVNN